MNGRALLVAVGLMGICFAVAAQQANRSAPTQSAHAFALSLYEAELLSANSSSLLFHKGPLLAWSDGGRLASETALAEIGMASLDLFPVAYVPSNASGPAPKKHGSSRADSPSGNFGTDAKDLSGMMMSPPDEVYYGGEVGVLYGRWTGKGGGDLIQSYMLGTVGNDRFQISAGAFYEDSSGHSARYHSYVFPR